MVAMIGQSQGIICSAIFSTDLVKASYLGINQTKNQIYYEYEYNMNNNEKTYK